ncbi:hypothetical protein A2U01_0091637, partial [Trifolium medium]|nr:hypothetical protein [Trifolium medium]
MPLVGESGELERNNGVNAPGPQERETPHLHLKCESSIHSALPQAEASSSIHLYR